MTDDLSIFEDENAFKTGDMNVITKNARELFSKQAHVKKLESDLDEAKKDLNNFSTKVVPAACANESSVKKFELGAGKYVLEIKPFVTASVPSDSKISKEKDPELKADLFELRQKCFEWLEENSQGIIKNQLIINLPKGEKGQEVIREITNRLSIFESENPIEKSRTELINYEYNNLMASRIKQKIEGLEDKILSKDLEKDQYLELEKQIKDLIKNYEFLCQNNSCSFEIMDKFNVEQKEDVHFQTLISFFKDFLGVDVENPKGNPEVPAPYDLFNIDLGEKATVKEVKQKTKTKK